MEQMENLAESKPETNAQMSANDQIITTSGAVKLLNEQQQQNITSNMYICLKFVERLVLSQIQKVVVRKNKRQKKSIFIPYCLSNCAQSKYEHLSRFCQPGASFLTKARKP
jgi:hypothetical protein